jgi:hypothetical protein
VGAYLDHASVSPLRPEVIAALHEVLTVAQSDPGRPYSEALVVRSLIEDARDEVAALTCALDLTLGPANATTNIAAACGAPVWLVSTPGAWPRLGTDRYPWYPQARIFTPQFYNRWGPVMAEVAAALKEAF